MNEIIIKNVHKSIKGISILVDINIIFKGGTIYGLSGKNGSGKTMLMRIISGLIFPTKGEVWINNKKLHKDIEFPESIGALIENPSFLQRYTGLENLEILAKLSKLRKEDASVAMKKVGLCPDDRKIYKKYSLGMKQKLGIANAIMGEPKIIILDEPINALDEESIKMVKAELIRLKNKERIIIVACHDKEELESLSDEIILVDSGQISKNKTIYKPSQEGE